MGGVVNEGVSMAGKRGGLRELKSGRSLLISPSCRMHKEFTFDRLSGAYSKRRLRR